MVCAGFARLVDDGLVSWDTPLHKLVPAFGQPDHTTKLEKLKTEANLTDLLAHRLGVAGRLQYCTQLHQKLLVKKEDTIAVVSDLAPMIEFRTGMAYNNWAYGLAGNILEDVTGESLEDYLNRTLFAPLNLNRTTLEQIVQDNYANSYIALSDATPYKIPRPELNDGCVLAAVGAAKSSINDLLVYYKSLMQSAEVTLNEGRVRSNPFKRTTETWAEQVSILPGSGYGLGWVTTSLPSKGGLVGMNAYPGHLGPTEIPIIGKGAKPGTRMIYHNGAIMGGLSCVYLLPETQTAIVVLTNTVALADCADSAGQILVDAVIGSAEQPDHLSLAKEVIRRTLIPHQMTNKQLADERAHNTSVKPLEDYTGTYFNEKGYFRMDVKVHGTGLRLVVQGLEDVYYDLYHYNYDIFAWDCDRDAESKKCMYPQPQIGLHRIEFQTDQSGAINALMWAYDVAIPAGEIFRQR